MDEAHLLRLRNVAAPVYMAALFILQVIMGYLLEYVPAGDNFMLYNGSELLAREGSFKSMPDFGLYLARFSNQWGFTLMLSGFYKLLFSLGFKHMFFPTVVLQALLYLAGVSAVLAIAHRLRGVRGMLMTIAMLMQNTLTAYIDKK